MHSYSFFFLNPHPHIPTSNQYGSHISIALIYIYTAAPDWNTDKTFYEAIVTVWHSVLQILNTFTRIASQ